MDDVNSLCRAIIGDSYTTEYVDQNLDLNYKIRNSLPTSINMGFDTWAETINVNEETSNMLPPLADLKLENRPLKREAPDMLTKLEALGTGQIDREWPLKHEILGAQITTEDSIFNSKIKMSRAGILKPRNETCVFQAASPDAIEKFNVFPEMAEIDLYIYAQT